MIGRREIWMLSWMVAAFACASAAAAPSAASDSVAIQGATLIDGTGADPVPDATLVIEGDTIACAGDGDDCEVPSGAEVRDLSGRWLVPGLVDAHVHLSQTGFFDGRPDALDLRDAFPFERVQARQRRHVDRYLGAWLCSGVTAIFDVGGFAWTIRLAAATRRSGRAGTPEVAATGPLISHAPAREINLPNHRQMVGVESPREARRVVGGIAQLGADAIKLWFLPVRDPARQRAVDARVRAAGAETGAGERPLVVHATTLREAKVALSAGADVLVHSVQDRPIDDEFLALARERNVIYVPTLIVGSGYVSAYRAVAGTQPFDLDDPNDCIDDATAGRLEGAARFRDHPSAAHLTPARLARMEARARRNRETAAANLRRVHRAGITIAAGSDAGNPGTPHGPSIYRELEAMAEAGIPAEEILVMATKHGARAMGREDVFGTIEAGKRADLVVLERDPLEDISALRTIDAVYRAGRAQ